MDGMPTVSIGKIWICTVGNQLLAPFEAAPIHKRIVKRRVAVHKDVEQTWLELLLLLIYKLTKLAKVALFDGNDK